MSADMRAAMEWASKAHSTCPCDDCNIKRAFLEVTAELERAKQQHKDASANAHMHYTNSGEWKRRAESAEQRAAELQARLDRLMLEYCPNEMTPEQVANWQAHQQVSPAAGGQTESAASYADMIIAASNAPTSASTVIPPAPAAPTFTFSKPGEYTVTNSAAADPALPGLKK